MSDISIIAQNMIEGDLNHILDHLETIIDEVISILNYSGLKIKREEAILERLNRLYYWYQLIQTEYW